MVVRVVYATASPVIVKNIPVYVGLLYFSCYDDAVY